MNPRETFIAAAGAALDGYNYSRAKAEEATKPDRKDYWENQAHDCENRARFYLARAREFEEEAA